MEKDYDRANKQYLQVTCDLIPLAVLKLYNGKNVSMTGVVTCDLIPLAVLKRVVPTGPNGDSNNGHM
mgnify:CR=1 FL=1